MQIEAKTRVPGRGASQSEAGQENSRGSPIGVALCRPALRPPCGRPPPPRPPQGRPRPGRRGRTTTSCWCDGPPATLLTPPPALFFFALPPVAAAAPDCTKRHSGRDTRRHTSKPHKASQQTSARRAQLTHSHDRQARCFEHTNKQIHTHAHPTPMPVPLTPLITSLASDVVL